MHHDPRSPCLPPAQYQRYMGMHWLQVLDYDGHSFGNIALQWNPGSRTWTHSQAHDTHGAGGGIETTGYKWLAFIPQPPLTDDDFDPSIRALNAGTLQEAIRGGTTVDDKGDIQVGNAVTAVMALVKPHLRTPDTPRS